MAVSYDGFLARFPELTPGGNADQQAKGRAVIEGILASAPKFVNALVWGDQADDGVAYLAAHRVVLHPAGIFARYAGKDGSSRYGEEYDRMRGMLLVGDRVV